MDGWKVESEGIGKDGAKLDTGVSCGVQRTPNLPLLSVPEEELEMMA